MGVVGGGVRSLGGWRADPTGVSGDSARWRPCTTSGTSPFVLRLPLSSSASSVGTGRHSAVGHAGLPIVALGVHPRRQNARAPPGDTRGLRGGLPGRPKRAHEGGRRASQAVLRERMVGSRREAKGEEGWTTGREERGLGRAPIRERENAAFGAQAGAQSSRSLHFAWPYIRKDFRSMYGMYGIYGMYGMYGAYGV